LDLQRLLAFGVTEYSLRVLRDCFDHGGCSFR
jgi:hypothetical protein